MLPKTRVSRRTVRHRASSKQRQLSGSLFCVGVWGLTSVFSPSGKLC
uniref:Uncharacterized protein n=1 Tax=Esox lucius TaxID=8010 RepID=A0A6Q2Y2R8_ESOLU